MEQEEYKAPTQNNSRFNVTFSDNVLKSFDVRKFEFPYEDFGWMNIPLYINITMTHTAEEDVIALMKENKKFNIDVDLYSASGEVIKSYHYKLCQITSYRHSTLDYEDTSSFSTIIVSIKIG